MLRCSCDYDDEYWAEPEEDFSVLDAVNWRKCRSCGKRIHKGRTVLKFHCYRDPQTEQEDARFGNKVPLADKFLCQSCGEIYLNLSEAGYCLGLGGDLREDLRDYWEITGFMPPKALTGVKNA